MSLSLVRHLWRTNREQIVKNSIAHCHAKGVHSICLLDEPGKRIRMFIASKGHTLCRNMPDRWPLSIGFHAHHCDIQLEVIRGSIVNRVLMFGRGGHTQMGKYRYESSIWSKSAPTFHRLGLSDPFSVGTDFLRTGECADMLADEFHTVAVPGNGAAWLVYEGAEDPAYEPITISDDDLMSPRVFEGLYQPMSARQITMLIDYIVCSNPNAQPPEDWSDWDFSAVGL